MEAAAPACPRHQARIAAPKPSTATRLREVSLRLDIVMPAHNEQDRIDRTLRAYRAACPRSGVRFSIALDSCTDATPQIVARHAREDERVRVFSYPKLGKGGVIAETFGRSDADLVGFVDADCATPPRELLRLAHAAERVG